MFLLLNSSPIFTEVNCFSFPYIPTSIFDNKYIYFENLPSVATSNAVATKRGPPKWLLLEVPLSNSKREERQKACSQKAVSNMGTYHLVLVKNTRHNT